MLLGMVPDLTLTAVKAAAEENAAESTQTVTFEGIDGTSGCGYGEGYESLFDGKYTESDGTKWCCDFSDSAYVIIEASVPVWIGGYTFVTEAISVHELSSSSNLYASHPYSFQVFGFLQLSRALSFPVTKV